MYVYLFIIDTKEKMATKGIHVHNVMAFSKFEKKIGVSNWMNTVEF